MGADPKLHAHHDSCGVPHMQIEHDEHEGDRIAIDGRIDCRDADDRHWVVLRWCRQLKKNVAGEGLRWVSVGPAVFTLADGSAVIQVSGSRLQIVATGKVLHVDEAADTVPAATVRVPAASWTSRLFAAPVAWFAHG
jgi:hypothetical protein